MLYVVKKESYMSSKFSHILSKRWFYVGIFTDLLKMSKQDEKCSKLNNNKDLSSKSLC